MLPMTDPVRCWYLKTYKTGTFIYRANVVIHIPAPWILWVKTKEGHDLTIPQLDALL